MFRIASLPSWRASVLLVSLFLGTAAMAASPLATVQSITGSATVKRVNAKAFTPLATRNALYPTEIVGTGTNSKLALLFADGSQVRLNADSAITISAPTHVGKGKTSLFTAMKGEMWARIRPDRAVQTKTAVAGVRGTEIDVRVATDDATTLTVIEGEVDFYNEHGEVIVGASQQSTARSGQPPTAPVTIQNTSTIIEWTAELELVAIPREHYFISPDRKLLAGEVKRQANAATSKPRDTATLLAYGDALFDSRQYAQAQAQYMQADRLAPHQAATLARLGYTAMELDDLTGSAAAFMRAAAINGKEPSALLGFAALEITRNRPVDAEHYARTAIAVSPQSAEAQTLLGMTLMRQSGKTESARAALTAGTVGQPPAMRYAAYAWRAIACLTAGDIDAALQDADTAVALAPDSILAHSNRSLVYLFAGDAAHAVQEAKAVLALNPQSVTAHCSLGMALLATGDVDAAVEHATRAVALDPGLPQARYLLGITDLQRRDYRHAEPQLEACLQLAPDFLPALITLARMKIAMGQVPAALAVMQEQVARHPDNADVHGALGALYHQVQNYAKAEIEFQTALQRRPQSALYHNELARTLLGEYRIHDALLAARHAVALAPNVAAYHETLGLCYLYSGFTGQADREFRDAIALNPQDALGRAVLGLEHHAIDLFSQAFLYDPEIPRQLLRPGERAEATVGVGRDLAQLDTTAQETLHNGSVQLLGFYGGSDVNQDLSRRNDRATFLYAAQNATLTATPRTNLYGYFSASRGTLGMPGVQIPGVQDDSDDHSMSFGTDAKLGSRTRFGNGCYFWSGFSFEYGDLESHDPDRQSFPYSLYGANTLQYTMLQPELRLDITLNPLGKQPAVLTLGALYSTTATKNNSDPLIAPAASTSTHTHTNLQYLQLTQVITPRWSYVGQLRAYRQTGTLFPESPLKASPGLGFFYRPDAKTTWRLYAQQFNNQFALNSYLPNELVLAMEAQARPEEVFLNRLVSFDTWQGAHVEMERNLPGDGLLKLFGYGWTLYHGEFGGTLLPATDPPRIDVASIRTTGIGMRIEKPLTRTLFATVVATANHSIASAPVEAFDDRLAPYQPSVTGQLALNYLDSGGRKGFIQADHYGQFYDDNPLLTGVSRSTFPAETYINLRLAQEFAKGRTELFVAAHNLFNAPEILFNGVPIRRTITGGIVWRF